MLSQAVFVHLLEILIQKLLIKKNCKKDSYFYKSNQFFYFQLIKYLFLEV